MTTKRAKDLERGDRIMRRGVAWRVLRPSEYDPHMDYVYRLFLQRGKVFYMALSKPGELFQIVEPPDDEDTDA